MCELCIKIQFHFGWNGIPIKNRYSSPPPIRLSNKRLYHACVPIFGDGEFLLYNLHQICDFFTFPLCDGKKLTLYDLFPIFFARVSMLFSFA